MATTESTLNPNSTSISLSSLILPGLGQFLLKKRSNGLLIFVTVIVSAFLINWSLVHQNIGKVSIGSLITSWLWLPFIFFWIWNILDARALAERKRFSLLPAIIFVALILYVIAWNVTGIKLGRLVERFNDARTVATNLLNPDVVTISINGEDKICAWSCMYSYVGDKLAGRPTAGVIRVSDNLLDIVGRVKLQAAPQWRVKLGLALPNSKVNTFVAGSMIETIAM